jgi:hypothetical protein
LIGLGPTPADRIAVGRALTEATKTHCAARNYAWEPVHRKGYVAFRRASGYNVAIVDVFWSKVPRFAVKIPDAPARLGLVSPYPELAEVWSEEHKEWGGRFRPLKPFPTWAVVGPGPSTARDGSIPRYGTVSASPGGTPPADERPRRLAGAEVAGSPGAGGYVTAR